MPDKPGPPEDPRVHGRDRNTPEGPPMPTRPTPRPTPRPTLLPPLAPPLALSKIIAMFGGSNHLGAYRRGGSFVPDIAENAAISTQARGLRISQFVGATRTK